MSFFGGWIELQGRISVECYKNLEPHQKFTKRDNNSYLRNQNMHSKCSFTPEVMVSGVIYFQIIGVELKFFAAFYSFWKVSIQFINININIYLACIRLTSFLCFFEVKQEYQTILKHNLPLPSWTNQKGAT